MYRRVFGTDRIQRLSDAALIAPHPNNRDYQEFRRAGVPLLDAVIPPKSSEPSPEDLVSALADLLGVDVQQLITRARERAALKR